MYVNRLIDSAPSLILAYTKMTVIILQLNLHNVFWIIPKASDAFIQIIEIVFF